MFGFDLAANLGMRRGENKDFVLVDLDPHILPWIQPRNVPDPGLERPFQPLHGNMDQVHLPEEAT
jgi:hypothetical protein